MRILQIGPIPPEAGGQTRGGVATHVWGLATNLAKRGHRVGVLAHNYLAAERTAEVKQGVEVYGRQPLLDAIRAPRVVHPSFASRVVRTKCHLGRLGNWRGVLGGLLDCERAVESFRPDVMHIHHLEKWVPFAHFASRGGIPTVVSVHSTAIIDFSDPSDRAARYRLVQGNLRVTRRLIFGSEFVRQRFGGLFPGGLKGRHSWVIHYPVDSSAYYPIPKEDARRRIHRDPHRPLILFVANLLPHKGAAVLIDAAELLRARGLRFEVVIVGSGPQHEQLEQRIRDKGLMAVVSLEGSAPDLLAYYNAADLFVLPSSYEGFGIVFLEAMACGCPVLGTPEVLKELLGSDECGWYVCPRTPAALADAIDRALSTAWDRQKIRTHGLSFDWSARISAFEEAYCQSASLASVARIGNNA